MSLANLIEIATNEKQTEDDWTKILDVCEKGTQNPKECLKLILKRLFNINPHIVLRSIILLDACVQNIGEPFTKELSSRYFVNEIKSKSKNIHQKALERLCFMMKKWSRELTGSEYDCINELNKWLQDTYPIIYAAGDDELNSRNPIKGNRKVVQGQEEEDLAKAIALSLKESQQKRQNLYPSNINHAINKMPTETVPLKKQLPKVRALYDFEAAEDNELTFKAGEIIIDVDMSNEHWWYGSNHRGQGMFPAQFVSMDVENEADKFGESNRAKIEKGSAAINHQPDSYSTRPITPVIDESKVDECLRVIEDADPTGELRPDPAELSKLEAQCRVMGPLIDQELEKVDRHYNMLVELNRNVIESFQLYNELMTQGGGSMNRPGNYMWPQPMGVGGGGVGLHHPHHAQFTSIPMQDPSQMMSRMMNENVNPAAPQSVLPGHHDPMLYQTMNYYGNMNAATAAQNTDIMYGSAGPGAAAAQLPFGPKQTIQQLPPGSSYHPTMSNVTQKSNFPSTTHNNSSGLNAQDYHHRSLPVQNNYSESSFQPPVAMINQPQVSYVQSDQTFPTADGFH